MSASLLILAGIFAGVGGIFLVGGDEPQPSSSATDNAPKATPDTPDRSLAPDDTRQVIALQRLQNALEAIANDRRSSEPQAREKPVKATPKRAGKHVRFEWLDEPGGEP